MYARNIKNEFYGEKNFSRRLELSDVKSQYEGFTVEETDGGFLLTSPATMTKYGAFDTKDRQTTFTLKLPQHQLVVEGEQHWPFEGIRNANLNSAYCNIAYRVARLAFCRGAVEKCRYGAIPGDFRFDKVGNPVFTVTTNRKEAYFLMFYSDRPLHGFAGSRRYNMVMADDIWMAFIPIALAEQMIA